jgi:hypothetical protein
MILAVAISFGAFSVLAISLFTKYLSNNQRPIKTIEKPANQYDYVIGKYWFLN